MDIWPTVHAERKALVADMRDLSAEDWDRSSLCSNWTVRDVLAHMTSAARLTPPAFFGKMIGSGFSFDKVQEKGVAANRGASPADTLAGWLLGGTVGVGTVVYAACIGPLAHVFVPLFSRSSARSGTSAWPRRRRSGRRQPACGRSSP